MRIAVLQQDIEWAAPATNIARADALLRSLPPADVYVLPEMWATGFCTDPTLVAEPATGGPIAQWMTDAAVRHGAAIVGSVAVVESGAKGNTYRNRLYCAMPNGTMAHYDKRHLFAYGGEDRHYTAGTERTIVSFRGVRILLQVCYDLRFPVFSRNGISTEADYDVACYVASWPSSRRAVWDTLVRARAIENQCYVVAVNRVGQDPQCVYDGGSTVIDPYGRAVATCADNVPAVAVADIDLERLTAFRRKFPVLADADSYTLL